MRNDSRLGRLIKIAAAFLQGENSELFKTKFGGEGDEEEVKDLARRFYAIFGTWTDYEAYRALVGSKNNIVEMKDFISKCEDKLASVRRIIAELNLGIQDRAIDDLGRQYLRKYVGEIDSDSFLSRLRELNKIEGRTGEDLYELLRDEKRKNRDAKVESLEFEGKDLSGIESYKDWMLKIKNSGEAHRMDDIISLVRTFLKMNARSGEKKNINDFSSYSELQRYIDDQSFVDKDAYIASIAEPATQNDMSKIIYEDERWKVVLIGSTVGGQWWGQGTDFCISRLENNLYSRYANKMDPYFIIDKAAASSDPMRKFTVAIEYDEDGNYKISKESSTMTNASNIGIWIGHIERALDGKWGMIKQKIMEESGSRKSSMGTVNKARIKKIIDNQDFGTIKLYEKEIAADEDLGEKFLNIVDSTNHAQYHGLISEIIKKEPVEFLNNFSEKEWANKPVESLEGKTFVEIALKAFMESKRNELLPISSENLLYRSFEKPWANKPIESLGGKTLIEVAKKELAEKEPYTLLIDFPEEDWANEQVESLGGKTWKEVAAKTLAEKDPYKFLQFFSEEYWAAPYVDGAAKELANRISSPDSLRALSKERWANKPVKEFEEITFLELIAKTYAENNPYIFLEKFSEEDWTDEPIEKLEGKTLIGFAANIHAERNPISFIDNFAKEPWAAPYIDRAVEAYVREDSDKFIEAFSGEYWAENPIERLGWKTWIQFARGKLNERRASQTLTNAKLIKLAKALNSLNLQKESAELLKIIE